MNYDDYDNEYNNYWDWVSTQDINTDGKFLMKDLIKDAYSVALPLIQSLMYIESDFIYLNLVCGIPQDTIAKMYGLSQLGVSKRVRSGIKKMKDLLYIPEKNSQVIVKDFYNLLPQRCREVAFLYYKTRVYSVTAQIMVEKPAKIRKIIKDTIKILETFISSKGKISARLNENPYKEYADKKDYREKLKDDEFRENEIIKAQRYLDYFKKIQAQYNYGNYHFKAQSRDFVRKDDII